MSCLRSHRQLRRTRELGFKRISRGCDKDIDGREGRLTIVKVYVDQAGRSESFLEIGIFVVEYGVTPKGFKHLAFVPTTGDGYDLAFRMCQSDLSGDLIEIKHMRWRRP